MDGTLDQRPCNIMLQQKHQFSKLWLQSSWIFNATRSANSLIHYFIWREGIWRSKTHFQGNITFVDLPLSVIAGLSLSYIMETLDYTQYAVRNFSEVENLMTSVERVITYTNLESEPGCKTKALPPKHWPRDWHVTLRNVTMTYYEGGPQVLRNLNFSIEGKSRIGVFGRTGAGKWSANKRH